MWQFQQKTVQTHCLLQSILWWEEAVLWNTGMLSPCSRVAWDSSSVGMEEGMGWGGWALSGKLSDTGSGVADNRSSRLSVGEMSLEADTCDTLCFCLPALCVSASVVSNPKILDTGNGRKVQFCWFNTTADDVCMSTVEVQSMNDPVGQTKHCLCHGWAMQACAKRSWWWMADSDTERWQVLSRTESKQTWHPRGERHKTCSRTKTNLWQFTLASQHTQQVLCDDKKDEKWENQNNSAC